MNDVFNLDKKAKLLQRSINPPPKNQRKTLNLDDDTSATESRIRGRIVLNKNPQKVKEDIAKKYNNSKRTLNLDESTVDESAVVASTADSSVISSDDSILDTVDMTERNSDDSTGSDSDLSHIGEEMPDIKIKLKEQAKLPAKKPETRGRKKSVYRLEKENDPNIKAVKMGRKTVYFTLDEYEEYKKKLKDKKLRANEYKKERNISKETILKNLKGYYKIEKSKWELIPINTHIRYITKDDMFFVGGFVKKISGSNEGVKRIMISNKKVYDTNTDTTVVYKINFADLKTVFALP